MLALTVVLAIIAGALMFIAGLSTGWAMRGKLPASTRVRERDIYADLVPKCVCKHDKNVHQPAPTGQAAGLLAVVKAWKDDKHIVILDNPPAQATACMDYSCLCRQYIDRDEALQKRLSA